MRLKNPLKHRDFVERFNGRIEFRGNRLTLKLSNQAAQSHENYYLENHMAYLNNRANQSEQGTSKLSSFVHSIRAPHISKTNEKKDFEDLKKENKRLADQNKLQAEQNKFQAEQLKKQAEQNKRQHELINELSKENENIKAEMEKMKKQLHIIRRAFN